MGARKELGLPDITAELPSHKQQHRRQRQLGSEGGKRPANPASEDKGAENKAQKKGPRNQEALPCCWSQLLEV